jgi:hypothetical protein
MNLSTCEVESICNYLVSPGGNILIFYNAPGCNSSDEVEEACLVAIEKYISNSDIDLYPNPSKKQLTISSKYELLIDEVNIYNQTGQTILHQKPANNTINISHLNPGMCFVEVIAGENRFMEKLIIQ